MPDFQTPAPCLRSLSTDIIFQPYRTGGISLTMNMNLIPLDSPYWETYTGAYGSVLLEIRILMGEEPISPQGKLRRLDMEEKDDYQIAFDNLCESLSHQMTCYDALLLALPYMVKLYQQKKAEGNFNWQVNILSQAGICLATDVPEANGEALEPVPEEIMSGYNAAVLILKELAQEFILENLDQIGLLDDDARNYLITGLIAIMGDHLLANVLVMSCWDEDECYLGCPDCDFCDEESSLTDRKVQGQLVPAQVKPWDGKSFDDPLCWITGILDKFGAEAEKDFITCYYGTYTCPECGRKALMLDFAKCYLFGE